MALTDNLVAYWKMDEASGNRVDSVASIALTPTNCTQAAGKLGNSVGLAAASSASLTTPDSSTLRLSGSAFTIACWTWFDTIPAGNKVIAQKGNTNGFPAQYHEWQLFINPGTGYTFYVNGGSDGTVNDQVVTPVPSTGAWHYVVAWYDPATGTASVQVDNGTIYTNTHALLGQINVTTNPMTVGSDGHGTSYLDGRVDSLGLWKRALTAPERQSLYNSGAGLEYPFTGNLPATIPVTDANIYWSPYNWDSDGAGSLQANNVRASSTFARSNTPGAYFKVGFTGTSAAVAVDVSALTAVSQPSFEYPRVAWSVDRGAWQYRQLVSSDAPTNPFSLATGLASGTHSLEVYFASIDPLGNQTGDRWITPVTAAVVASLQLDYGAATAAPTLRPRRAIVYGDSITEGVDDLDGLATATSDDAGQTWASLVCRSLGAEYGMVAFESQGYTVGVGAGGGSVPSVANAWNLYSAGRSRLVSGLFSPAPDYIVSAHGTNDPSLTAAQLAAQIAAWRAAAPAAKILICQTFSQTAAAGIAAGVALAADPNVYLLDPGEALASLQTTFDGLHPSARGHAIYGAMLAARAGTALAPATTSTKSGQRRRGR